jgi:hypothetical protein
LHPRSSRALLELIEEAVEAILHSPLSTHGGAWTWVPR